LDSLRAIKTNGCNKNTKGKKHLLFGKKHSATYFCTRYDNYETYKAHKETFLMEGLRYVCNNIKFLQPSLPEGFLLYLIPLPEIGEMSKTKRRKK
jgi:hypothetical protein